MALTLIEALLFAYVLIAIVLIVLAVRYSKRPHNPNDCPSCQDGVMCALRSQDVKMCSSCGHSVPWQLKPGQLPLVSNNRQTRKEKHRDSDH